MTTGVVRDGLVKLEGDPLPDGTRVRVIADPEPRVERGDWLERARQLRSRMPMTNDSVEILRNLREAATR